MRVFSGRLTMQRLLGKTAGAQQLWGETSASSASARARWRSGQRPRPAWERQQVADGSLWSAEESSASVEMLCCTFVCQKKTGIWFHTEVELMQMRFGPQRGAGGNLQLLFATQKCLEHSMKPVKQ